MVTNAEARFNNSLRPWKPEGSLERTAQDGHLDSHTAPELSPDNLETSNYIYIYIYLFLTPTQPGWLNWVRTMEQAILF